VSASEHSDSGDPRPAPVAIRETHSGVVVLIGDLAYKLKKPVDLGFLDFAAVSTRQRACQRELELNRRLAPDVYLDVAAVTGSDAHPMDYLLVMRRMPEELRLSTMVTRGADVDDQLRAVARLMADFHARADRAEWIDAEGGAEGLRRRWTDNLRETRRLGQFVDAANLSVIESLALTFVDGRGPLLADRVAAGLIVDGHGDLLADDVFCLPDYPRVLDCLDFSDQLRCVDVLDDVCFLAMDLERLGRPDLAERFLGWYHEFIGAPVVPSLQHHYIAYRAFVRAKVACLRAEQGIPEAVATAQALTELTVSHLQAGEPTLILVGGAPGTGKTTLSQAISERLGAALLSTDSLRAQRFTRSDVDPYTDQAKAAVYRELLDRARHALAHGASVVADATWGDASFRAEAAQVAANTASRLLMIECRVAAETAAARAQQRFDAGTSPSRADAQIARRLAARFEPWPNATTIDTESASTALRTALAVVARQPVAGS
jgi:aminoglycoside phosphotransferase family enzyme/predicted kinase